MGVVPDRDTIIRMGTPNLQDPPKEALDLHESIGLFEAASSGLRRPDGTEVTLGFDGEGNPKDGGVFDSAGRVPLHIIRPGIGKGKGRHLYEAGMLQEAAPGFTGWKMFLNHLSPEAKRAAGGLPRDIRDSGGRVQESWWDDSVPANPDSGHGQGAVVGMVRPVKFIRDLVDDDPQLAEASISAQATGVRPVTRDGQRVWLVEGIEKRGSVDWVTEAGAGGRIAALLQEAYADEEDVHMAILESMSDEEIVAHLRDRPGLLAEAKSSKKDDDNDAEDKAEGPDDDNDAEDKAEALKKKGLPPALAKKAASKAVSESHTQNTPDPEGGDVAEITPEALTEALSASPNLLVEALSQSGDAQVFIASLVEAKLEEERDSIRAEARADVDRAFQLAKFERAAHQMIAESKLPESWQGDLRARYMLVENEPTPALDVEDDLDAEGAVTKPALTKLRESVTSQIEHERERLREASATRVRSAKPVALAEAAAATDDKPATKKDKPYWAQILSEAGVHDPDEAYAVEG